MSFFCMLVFLLLTTLFKNFQTQFKHAWFWRDPGEKFQTVSGLLPGNRNHCDLFQKAISTASQIPGYERLSGYWGLNSLSVFKETLFMNCGSFHLPIFEPKYLCTN